MWERLRKRYKRGEKYRKCTDYRPGKSGNLFSGFNISGKKSTYSKGYKNEKGDGDLIQGRGDAYCGMLNCSYNLGMRHLRGYIPEYPVGTAEELCPSTSAHASPGMPSHCSISITPSRQK